MSTFELIILPAITTGLSAMAIPGPLQAYLLNITLRYGWRRGLLVIFAPLIVDGPIILVTVFLLGQLPELALQGIRFVGGGLLLYIAWGAWKQYRAGASFEASSDDAMRGTISPLRVLGTAAAMNVFSPGPYLFWATINGPLLLEALAISNTVALGMLLAFYGTFLGGLAVLVLLFDRLGKVDSRLTRMILLVTIVLLVWFGTSLIAEAFGLSAWHNVATQIGLALLAVYALWQMLQQRRRVNS